MDESRLHTALELFDSYNSNDPKRIVSKGIEFPQELFFAIQVHKWIKKLAPSASEVLLLASRCQHIGRWEVPRETYPEGKVGYLNWRSHLKNYHAERAGHFMAEAGYDEPTISSVQQIILKKNIKEDPEVQTMENALCLVFLQFEYDDFIKKHDDAKVIRILQKTWLKMSQAGKDEALKLSFSTRGTELIKKALSL